MASGRLFRGELFGKELERQGLSEELGDVSHVHAAHEIKSVDLYRSNADVEVSGHFTIAHSSPDEVENFLLAWRQSLQRPGGGRRRRGWTSPSVLFPGVRWCSWLWPHPVLVSGFPLLLLLTW